MSQHVPLQKFLDCVDENNDFYREKVDLWIKLFSKGTDNTSIFLRWLHCQSGMSHEDKHKSMKICQRAMEKCKTML